MAGHRCAAVGLVLCAATAAMLAVLGCAGAFAGVVLVCVRLALSGLDAELGADVLGLPVWAYLAAAAAADVALIIALGKAHLRTLQAALVNVTIIVPANLITGAAYYLLFPVRLVWEQFETMLFTEVISIFSIKTSFWKANWDQLLDAFPIGYKAILDLAKDKVPTDDILAMPAGSDEARQTIRTAAATPVMAGLRADIAKVLPGGAAQSVLFSVGFVVVAIPMLCWWLCGRGYVPLLNAHGPDSSEKGTAVHLKLPKCKFLVKAREKYGEEKGWTACNNECMLGMEELFSGPAGLLDAHWEVRPDRDTAQCTFCMYTGGKTPPVKDIEDL
eukprot:TRINITY_DN22707_c0_g1_i1.p1 TRINITY_DN22707_c0_g1~~TRINITY_DN22707_c0_g1_i1.p1  ORF type:complete len:354 (+),score=125.35 TRINITY_DN22707_c0_g1_i1:72-1064(+)